MEDTTSQPTSIVLIFGWPYKFFNTQNIQREYRSKYGGYEVTITFDNDHDIFHLTCRYQDADIHTRNFTRFMNGYIQDELSKSIEDVISQDAIQIERLHVEDNKRSRYFESARASVARYLQDSEMLVGNKSFQSVLSYSSQTASSKNINRQLFKDVAQFHGCWIYWLKGGLGILSENEENLQTMVELLQPVLRLLEGIRADLYWAENLPQLKFRFRKPANSVDQSIPKLRDFSSTYLDLHLTKWDPNSSQDLTLRPVVLGKIEYPDEARNKNPWLKRKSFQYGSEESNPSRWITFAPSGDVSSEFMYTERASQIHNWVQKTNKDLKDSTLDDPSSPNTASFASDGKPTKIIPPGAFGSQEQGSSSRQDKKTDIIERQGLQENYDFDKPRTRRAPLLKAASNGSSATRSNKSKPDNKPHLQFIDILEQLTTKLVSTIVFFNHEVSSLTIDIGQLFVLSAIVPSIYQPSKGLHQEALSPSDWDRTFPRSDEVSTPTKSYFSSRLTTCAEDALYMSTGTMKASEDNKILQPIFCVKPFSDRTTYKIHCQNRRTGTIALIVIEQNGKTEIQPSPQEVGHVNIHFPQFIWDARVACSARSNLAEDDDGAFQQLLNSIWIGSGEGMPIYEEAVYLHKSPQISILSCRCHRERVHQSAEAVSDEKAIYLHITRIEELQLSDVSLARDEMCVYTRPLQSSSRENISSFRQEQNLWYEACLTSPLVDSLLPRPSGPVYLDPKKGPVQTLLPLQEDLNFRNSLREALIPLLGVTQNVIDQWNNVGSGDRVESARVGGSSVTAQSAYNDSKDRFARDTTIESRSRVTLRDSERPK